MEIMFRDCEISTSIKCLLDDRSVILHGRPGVGKRSVFNGLKEVFPVPTIEVDVARLVTESADCGIFEESFDGYAKLASQKKAVLFVPNIELLKVLEDGSCSTIFGGQCCCSGSVFRDLCRMVALGDLTCVATTNSYKSLQRISNFYCYFTAVEVREMTATQSIECLNANKRYLEDTMGMLLSNKAISAAVTMTQEHFPHQHLPGKAIDLLTIVGEFEGCCNLKSLVREVSRTTDVASDELFQEISQQDTPMNSTDFQNLDLGAAFGRRFSAPDKNKPGQATGTGPRRKMVTPAMSIRSALHRVSMETSNSSVKSTSIPDSPLAVL
ncbi:hypothetical protein NDN08_002407 [Rhodosorus marinus]|uniref:ClpA/ClpB AAA lid domain-containing protein n=1 Tax=Rhodosorus marinus TaxID=101924 RepID=A0AAV8UV23_9RHOD|nr:hypothetical protein NDN08_002407 [Rhodosorus marinus]